MVMAGDHYVIDNVNVTLKEKLSSILPRCDGLPVVDVAKREVETFGENVEGHLKRMGLTS